MFNLKKKYSILLLPLIASIPPLLISCSSHDYSIENQIIEDEIQQQQQQLEPLKLQDGVKPINFNLLNVAGDNYQLERIFKLPSSKTIKKNGEIYKIWYSWGFLEKNIVSFEQNGNINFEVNVNSGILNSSDYVTKPMKLRMLIEPSKTSTTQEAASCYSYNGIKFKSVRSDVFEKSTSFNLDFFSKNSIINNRPVIIKNEKKARNWSAIDAYSNESLVENPEKSAKYEFKIDLADFDEHHPTKGIYKIKVSPNRDESFNNSVIEYAKSKGISFDKYYYYYEQNVNFKYPTSNNISSHNEINTELANKIGNQLSESSLAFRPKVNNFNAILGLNASEIVKKNNEIGGIFSPPNYYREHSIEPYKKVVFGIESVEASGDSNYLIFKMKIEVGNSAQFIVSNVVDKTILVKDLF